MQNNFLQNLAMLSQAQNPQAMMMQMFGQNPNFQKVLQLANGKSPEQFKQYVINLCNTQGIDINSLARQFNLPL